MGDLEDFQGFGDALQREIDRLGEFDERDRPHVKRFLQRLDGRVATSTLAEYLKNLRSNAGRLDTALVDLDEDAFDEFVFDLRHSSTYGIGDTPGFSDGTVRNYQFAICKFLRMTDGYVDTDLSWADDVELVSPAKNTVSPDDMLGAADIRALCDGANNFRDIALIEFLADTACRLSLLGSLRVGDVDLRSDRATYTPNPNAAGLKGADVRPYPIIDSRATLRTYLGRMHPRPDRDDVALFHCSAGNFDTDGDDDGALTPQSIRKQLRKAARSGGVDKPSNPHNFRHSAITRMRREGYDRAEIEHRVHWTVDSNMWRTYEHIDAREHNESIFSRAGLGDTEVGPSPERAPCGNCRETVAPHHEYCPRCGDGLTPDAREAVSEATAEGSDILIMVDGEAHRVAAGEIVRGLATGDVHPSVDHHDRGGSDADHE